MTWFGTALTEEQSEVVELARMVSATLPSPELARDDPDALATSRRVIVESGIWSIAADETVGGGGAPHEIRQAAFIAMGGTHAALMWGSAQAHAAASALQTVDPPTATTIASGSLPVAVVDVAGPRAITQAETEALVGITRIDACDPAGAILALGDGWGWWVGRESVLASRPLRCTGLAGAATEALTIDPAKIHRLEGIDTAAVRSSLALAAAAISAGLCVASAERAIDYAEARIQFGEPIANIPAVARSLKTQRASTMRAVSLAMGEPLGDPERSLALATASMDEAIEVASAAVQVHGGYGYLREFSVERLLRDAVSLRAAAA